jgi:hypothetical protein
VQRGHAGAAQAVGEQQGVRDGRVLGRGVQHGQHVAQARLHVVLAPQLFQGRVACAAGALFADAASQVDHQRRLGLQRRRAAAQQRPGQHQHDQEQQQVQQRAARAVQQPPQATQRAADSGDEGLHGRELTRPAGAGPHARADDNLATGHRLPPDPGEP